MITIILDNDVNNELKKYYNRQAHIDQEIRKVQEKAFKA